MRRFLSPLLLLTFACSVPTEPETPRAAPTVPDAPTAVIGSAIQAGRYELRWTPPRDDGGSSIRSYRLRAIEQGVDVSAAGPSHTFTHVLAPGTYVFLISAVNGVGEGPPAVSDPLVVTAAALIQWPTGDVQLTLKTEGTGIFWEPPQWRAPEGYRITVPGLQLDTVTPSPFYAFGQLALAEGELLPGTVRAIYPEGESAAEGFTLVQRPANSPLRSLRPRSAGELYAEFDGQAQGETTITLEGAGLPPRTEPTTQYGHTFSGLDPRRAYRAWVQTSLPNVDYRPSPPSPWAQPLPSGPATDAVTVESVSAVRPDCYRVTFTVRDPQGRDVTVHPTLPTAPRTDAFGPFSLPTTSQATRYSYLWDSARSHWNVVDTVAPGVVPWVEGVQGVAAFRPISLNNRAFGPDIELLPSARNRKLLARADLNGDAYDDLVILHDDTDGTAQPFYASATGALTPGAAVALGILPATAHVDDLDGDGDDDLAVSSTAGELKVLFTGAGGSLGTPHSFTLDRAPQAIAGGDFDGDGDPDLAVRTSALGLFLRGEDGSWAVGPTRSIHDYDPTLAAANIDADPADELVMLVNRNVVRVDLEGDGTLTGTTLFDYTVELNTFVSYLQLVDVSNDGVADLHLGGGVNALYVNDGTGAFERSLAHPLPPPPVSDTKADFNGSGWPMEIWFDGQTLRIGGTTTQFTGGWLHDLAVGDFNGDGVLDVALIQITESDVSGPSSRVALLPGRRLGGCTPQGGPADFEAPTTGLLAADLDADGRTDLVGISAGGAEVRSLRAIGHQTFLPVQVNAAVGASALVAAELAGARGAEVVVRAATGASLSILAWQGSSLQPLATVTLDAAAGAVAAVGETGRARRDLAVATADGALSVYRWDDAGFPRVQHLTGLPPASALLATDLDLDTHEDLVWFAADGSAAHFFYGGPGGLTAGGQESLAGMSVTSAYVARTAGLFPHLYLAGAERLGFVFNQGGRQLRHLTLDELPAGARWLTHTVETNPRQNEAPLQLQWLLTAPLRRVQLTLDTQGRLVSQTETAFATDGVDAAVGRFDLRNTHAAAAIVKADGSVLFETVGYLGWQ